MAIFFFSFFIFPPKIALLSLADYQYALLTFNNLYDAIKIKYT